MRALSPPMYSTSRTLPALLGRHSAWWLLLLLACLPDLNAQTVVTFNNPATLTLEEITGGPASIYPSTINVSGLIKL